jgi:hypothetical protein
MISSIANNSPIGPPKPKYTFDKTELLRTVHAGVQANLKLVVWDFDLTILAIHSFAERVSPASIASRCLEDDFIDLEFFRELINTLLINNIHVAIASFGRYEVIQEYLKYALKDILDKNGFPPFTRDNIMTPSLLGVVDGCSLKDGKNGMLQLLLQRYELNSLKTGLDKIDVSNILFFDDDPLNVELARRINIGAIHSPTGFHYDVWENAINAFMKGQALVYKSTDSVDASFTFARNAHQPMNLAMPLQLQPLKLYGYPEKK